MTTDKSNTASDPQPAELADASVIEHIAQQWDGCKYEAPGETLDIGAAIRRAGKRLSSELAEQQGEALPRLPEAFEAEFAIPVASPVSVYTAEQMQEYARAALAARQPGAQVPVAWVHEEDSARVISARQKATALRDQGASGSSVRPYSVPAFLKIEPAQGIDLGAGIKAITAERERQLQAEGFTRDGDQQYGRGELAKAATAYVQLAAMDLEAGTRDHIAWHGPAAVWPWAREWWKPVDARRDLVRAGALIAAQIDLMDSQAVGN